MVYKVGNETRKKLITDLRSKCLSTLGFNSDVFEGLYDDNRYVEKARATVNNKAVVERATAAISEATTKETLDKIKKYYTDDLKLSSPVLTKLNKLWDVRIAEVA
jgi:hypothetical protein